MKLADKVAMGRRINFEAKVRKAFAESSKFAPYVVLKTTGDKELFIALEQGWEVASGTPQIWLGTTLTSTALVRKSRQEVASAVA